MRRRRPVLRAALVVAVVATLLLEGQRNRPPSFEIPESVERQIAEYEELERLRPAPFVPPQQPPGR